ncbi:MAG: hypothetical protein F6K08_16615 [Okeania sp. SIO1H6]|nr:hypothetical protein [Okeania sp. SIO1H6]
MNLKIIISQGKQTRLKESRYMRRLSYEKAAKFALGCMTKEECLAIIGIPLISEGISKISILEVALEEYIPVNYNNQSEAIFRVQVL